MNKNTQKREEQVQLQKKRENKYQKKLLKDIEEKHSRKDVRKFCKKSN